MNTKFARIALSASLVALLAMSGCATNQTATQPLIQQADNILRSATPGLTVSASAVKPEVRIGEAVAIDVTSSAPGYVYVYQLSTDGKTLDLVFPNSVDGANFSSGGTMNLPRPTWKMTSHGPAGLGYFVTVLASKQQDLIEVATQAKAGKIAIDGPYGATMTSLREITY